MQSEVAPVGDYHTLSRDSSGCFSKFESCSLLFAGQHTPILCGAGLQTATE